MPEVLMTLRRNGTVVNANRVFMLNEYSPQSVAV
jgi:hypothetical protein